jgi:hypothetical protein
MFKKWSFAVARASELGQVPGAVILFDAESSADACVLSKKLHILPTRIRGSTMGELDSYSVRTSRIPSLNKTGLVSYSLSTEPVGDALRKSFVPESTGWDKGNWCSSCFAKMLSAFDVFMIHDWHCWWCYRFSKGSSFTRANHSTFCRRSVSRDGMYACSPSTISSCLLSSCMGWKAFLFLDCVRRNLVRTRIQSIFKKWSHLFLVVGTVYRHAIFEFGMSDDSFVLSNSASYIHPGTWHVLHLVSSTLRLHRRKSRDGKRR